jgi:hypothetical protein
MATLSVLVVINQIKHKEHKGRSQSNANNFNLEGVPIKDSSGRG